MPRLAMLSRPIAGTFRALPRASSSLRCPQCTQGMPCHAITVPCRASAMLCQRRASAGPCRPMLSDWFPCIVRNPFVAPPRLSRCPAVLVGGRVRVLLPKQRFPCGRLFPSGRPVFLPHALESRVVAAFAFERTRPCARRMRVCACGRCSSHQPCTAFGVMSLGNGGLLCSSRLDRLPCGFHVRQRSAAAPSQTRARTALQCAIAPTHTCACTQRTPQQATLTS
jgi:hypothetical protein